MAVPMINSRNLISSETRLIIKNFIVPKSNYIIFNTRTEEVAGAHSSEDWPYPAHPEPFVHKHNRVSSVAVGNIYLLPIFLSCALFITQKKHLTCSLLFV